jgi:uncharacterized protein YndB with AHSA1/START domain/DNA-binding transcriptional ArsR family regulator
MASMDDEVFKALAHDGRRTLLDRLFERDGQTLGELEGALPGMTRFGVMKHLRVLEAAGLVTSRKVGRERHHYLNPVPIRRIHDRWLDRFRIRAADLLDDLRSSLEADTTTIVNHAAPASPPEHVNPTPIGGRPVTTEPPGEAPPRHVFTTFIRATPELIWRALTESDFTTRYWYGSSIESSWTVGDPWQLLVNGAPGIKGEVLEADPPRRLALTYQSVWAGVADDVPSRLSFEIKGVGPGVCQLTVVHETEPGQGVRIADAAAGWPYIIAGLKTLLETGEPMASHD